MVAVDGAQILAGGSILVWADRVSKGLWDSKPEDTASALEAVDVRDCSYSTDGLGPCQLDGGCKSWYRHMPESPTLIRVAL
jgi:hypothetical protein